MTGHNRLRVFLLLGLVLMSGAVHVLASTERIRHAHHSKCPAGKYGTGCRLACQANCYTCSSSAICDTCNNTSKVYGPLCDEQCDMCKNEKCDRNRCTDGCKDGLFETERQILVLPTVYGCELCPDTCATCQSRSNCTRCRNERWGETCEIKCPSDCRTCHQSTGQCLYTTCEHGQYGLDGHCTSCPSSCLACNSAENCTTCVGERTGNTCENLNCTSISHCTECRCATPECDSSGITCLHCDDDFCGEHCERKCSTDEEVTTGAAYAIISTKSDKSVANPSSNAISIFASSHKMVMFIICLIISIIYFR